MTDYNITIAAIQCHCAALSAGIQRHLTNVGRCKFGSVVIIAGLLFLSAGKMQAATIVCAGGVVVLMALTEACHMVMARAITDAYNGFMKKLPLNGGNAMKAEECFVLPRPELGLRQAGQVFGALASFSVWPFYGALLAAVLAVHVQTNPEAKTARLLTSSATKAGCAAGGGCGTTGGCGSGGCGASSGKGCGCGSESAAKKSQPITPKAAAKPVSSSLQMNVVPRAGEASAPFQPGGAQHGSRPVVPPANGRPQGGSPISDAALKAIQARAQSGQPVRVVPQSGTQPQPQGGNGFSQPGAAREGYAVPRGLPIGAQPPGGSGASPAAGNPPGGMPAFPNGAARGNEAGGTSALPVPPPSIPSIPSIPATPQAPQAPR